MKRTIQLFAAIALLTLASCADITFEEPAAHPPLSKIRITKHNGRAAEIFATLQPGERLTNIVDISIFDGLDYRMTADAAKQRFGDPHTVRTDPVMQLPVAVYNVPQGQIGFMSVPTSGGSPRQPQVSAYLTNQSPDAIIVSQSVCGQLLPLLPTNKSIRVHLQRDVGFGGITLNMSSKRIEFLILGPREGQ